GNGEDANQNGVCLLAELRGQSPSRFVIARQTLSPWTELHIYKIRHTEQNENTPTASPVGQGLRTYPTGNALKGVKSGFTGRWLTM
ncbi:hypothetical protein J9B10_26840, partial [Klebsiella pneumoniae]